jgi:eukaryotic-like serine/threonine-protein kinase
MTATGYLVGSRYEVDSLAERGSISEVHRGRDLRLGRDVAIKVLRADLARDPSFQARFRREAQNAASLNHPAIVAVYDTGETEGESDNVPAVVIPFVVMEYVDGDTLREVLKEEGPLPPRRAMEIVADICAALDFSHRHGIFHGDIKPAKVMLNRAGAVKVMDFGIARGEAVDARSDVYATGCVLYELLCGASPFAGDSPVAVASQHVREEPRPPSDTKPGLPQEIDAIVGKTLNKNPLNRYQTAAEMRSDLVRALSGEGVQAAALLAPPSRSMPDLDWEPDQPAQRSRARAWGFVGIGVLCVALLAGAIWLTVRVLSAPPPTALVAVPDLSGMSLEQATKTLQDKGLTLDAVSRADSSDEMKEKVVAQRPSSHTEVTRNAPVDVVIGKGVSATTVPDVVGDTPAVAQQAITAAHLVYAEKNQPSSDADKGRVIAQDPASTSAVAPNATVTVTIGSGMTMVAVPKGIVGKDVAAATALLEKAKLTVVTEEGDSAKPVNQVIAVDQRSGDKVPEGTPVTLTISNNSGMAMPNVQNQTPDQAVATLRSKGWQGDAGSLTITEQVIANPAQVGVVLSQQPAVGAAVNKTGTPVSVAVGIRGITVPDLVGKTRQQAERLLQRAGATNVTFIDAGTPPRGQANRVQSQSVPANTGVGADAAITVSVYGG